MVEEALMLCGYEARAVRADLRRALGALARAIPTRGTTAG